ncbi:MAG: hypothetical protein RL173_3664 [Fibrobacterota bacterium]|jgi:PAS domain S-box-containing protein
MRSRELVEIDTVQKKVVDVIHLALCVFGTLSVGVGIVRARFIGNLLPIAVPVLLILVAFCLWPFRSRISWFTRSAVLLLGMMGVGFSVLWNYGLLGSAGVLLPTTVVVVWLIWDKRPATYFTFGAVVLFVFATGKNILSGSSLDSSLSSYNHTLIFWLNLGTLYAAVGSLILGVTRVLFGAFRRVLLRTQEGESRSRLDKERLVGILKGVNDAIFLHDADTGQILEVFGRYSEMYGFSSEEILAGGVGPLSAQFENWTDESALGWMQKCVEDGPQTFTWRSRRADDSLFWTEVSMRPILLDKLERILVTVRDIDTLMNSHLELASLNADLERRVLLRTAEIQRERDASDAFSYTVSHDLRAPLRAIDGYARILTEDYSQQLSDEARKYLGRMVVGAERMSRLIDALLSHSRLERQNIALETVDVAKLLDEVHQELRDAGNCRIQSHGFCDMAWSIGPLPEIRSDPQLAKQVFANLVGNACKFTRESSEPRISIRALERPDGIWFEIADNGSGFDMAYSDKLFKVFQRLHPDSIEGIGIGLATVKKIVDRLGGAVEAEATPGEGATFRVRLEPARMESIHPA